MASHRTTWSSKTSSLPSDRIPTRSQRSAGAVSTLSGSKSKHKDVRDITKSAEVRRLEGLRDGLLQALSGGFVKDPKGGCFCQARNHSLSLYNPACRSCGLILCGVNLPYHSCPHCASPLLAPDVVESTIASLEATIADTLAKEEQAREQAVEEARKAAGAFPALAAASASTTSLHSSSGANTPPNALDAHPVNQSHKVLSVNAKTKRVTVSSFTTAPRPVGRTPGRETPPAPEPLRVPRPPREVQFFSPTNDPDRPWINARMNITYVPPPKEPTTSEASQSKSKRKKGPKQPPAPDPAGSTSLEG